MSLRKSRARSLRRAAARPVAAAEALDLAFAALSVESDSYGMAMAPIALTCAKAGLEAHEAVVACTRGSSKKFIGNVVSDHCYVVTAVDLAHSTVTVYNPWGVDGTASDSNPNDGLVKMSVTEFVSRFDRVVVGDV